MATVPQVSARTNHNTICQLDPALDHGIGTNRGARMQPGIGSNNGTAVHTARGNRGVAEQLAEPGKRQVGRLRDQALGGTGGDEIRMHDHRTRPGSRQLGQIPAVGQKGQVLWTGLSQGGQAGNSQVAITGKRQTEPICQFDQRIHRSLLRRGLVQLVGHFSGNAVTRIGMDNRGPLQQQANAFAGNKLAQDFLHSRGHFLQQGLAGSLFGLL